MPYLDRDRDEQILMTALVLFVLFVFGLIGLGVSYLSDPPEPAPQTQETSDDLVLQRLPLLSQEDVGVSPV